PQDCIRPADFHLLRTLTDPQPSKILISSRLMPSALLSDSGAIRAGVSHAMLNGLAPVDAELMLRQIGVRGSSDRIRNYLTKNFACHPLIVGVVGGLVRKSSRAAGDFDRWADAQPAEDRTGPETEFVRSRHRILWTAFEDLSDDARTLLSRVALVSEAVDYETMVELNPSRPEPPEVVPEPDEWLLEIPNLVEEYKKGKAAYAVYLQDLDSWRRSVAFVEAEKMLRELIQDLTARGLLQADEARGKCDLHPVVRGYAVSCIGPEQRDGVGQRVVDHFASRVDCPSHEATRIDDLRNGLQVARTLLHLGRAEPAVRVIDRLSAALFWSIEAFDVYLALVMPLFPGGWDRPLPGIDECDLSSLWNDAALALSALGKPKEAMALPDAALRLDIRLDRPWSLLVKLRNLEGYARNLGSFYAAQRLNDLVTRATSILGNQEDVALGYLHRLTLSAQIGDFATAEHHWTQFDALPRPSDRHVYRPGYGEFCLAWLRLQSGTLDEALLSTVEHLAKAGNSRYVIRSVAELRGNWKLSLG